MRAHLQVRRRLQMQSEKPREQWNYSGTVDCFKKIYKHEGGLPAFFKGAGANALRTVGSALVLVLYDELKASLCKAAILRYTLEYIMSIS